MANIDLKFADTTSQQLALSTVDGIQHIPITRNGAITNIPFERFVLADDSTVFIFVLTAFISSGLLKNQNPEVFHYGFGALKDAMVAPTADLGTDVWKFQYKIRINNDKSDYSIIEVVSGEMPPGLVVDSTKTATDNVQIDGKASESSFPNNSWADNQTYDDFKGGGFENSFLELLDVVYVDAIDGNVIENPTDTFQPDTPLMNMSNDARIVSSVSTYTENNVVKNKVVIPYVDFVERNGVNAYEALDLPRNEVLKDGKLTSGKDSNFKGYVTGLGEIVAYYKDIKTVYTTTADITNQHQKDYTFTLGMRDPDGTEYFAQQEFTIRVLQNHDQVRNQQQAFNNYPLHSIHYDPSQNYYIVDFLLPLIRSNGDSTNIKIEDGTLILNTDKEIEAFGILPLYQNDNGKRIQNDMTLGAG